MKQNHQIAYDYAMALRVQNILTEQLNTALGSLGSDNQVFSLAEPIEVAYTKLVQSLLLPELFEWLMWWMYETDFGTKAMMFSIDDIEYNPTNMTLYSFLETIDASY
jgi:hypothetical protein